MQGNMGTGRNSDMEVQSDSEGSAEDMSLLQKPLRTAFTGFREAKAAYENGTDEVRRLLLYECALIYECNACRNMFRSLANFISHKRVYCRQRTEGNNGDFPDNDASVIIQAPDCNEAEVMKGSRVSPVTSPVPKRAPNRDLSKVIERLMRGEEKNLSEKQRSAILQLERVPTSDQAVYQTLKREDTDSIKTEVDEVNSLLSNVDTTLGPDGKAIVRHAFDKGDAGNKKAKCQIQTFSGPILCDICNVAFQTEKTLKIHIQKKHTSSTYVFQCPACSLTFLQPAAVIRHLANEHKKPLHRIRTMRETIFKRRVQMSDVQTKGPSRELKRLKISETEGAACTENEQQGKIISTCVYCGRSFERRAALSTHLLNCRAKQSETVEPTSDVHTKSSGTVKNLKLLPLEYLTPVATVKSENGPDQCSVDLKENFDRDSKSTLNEMFENLGKQSFGSDSQTVSLDKLDISDGVENAVLSTEPKTVKEEEGESVAAQGSSAVEDTSMGSVNSVGKKIQQRFRIVHSTKHLACRCKICNKQFNALSNLRRHISMFHYRARRFGCTLCDYRAFRRYDIVNHLGYIHKMTGERETMSTEYVSVHEVNYSKEDVDGDIVVVTEDNEAQKTAQEGVVKTYEKAVKKDRKKSGLPSSVAASSVMLENGNMKTTRQNQKLKRTSSHPSDGPLKTGQKRPIRNRIKPVNKDFVYDLSNLQDGSRESMRSGLKRRNTLLPSAADALSSETGTIKISPYMLRSESLVCVQRDIIKGSVRRLSQLLVNQGFAAPSTLPELPTERPQIRPRLTSTCRGELPAVPVIETSELEAARLKSTFLDDSFLEKISKHSPSSFRMKPLLVLQHSPLSSLLQKVDSSLNGTITGTNSKEEPPKVPEEPDNSAISVSPTVEGVSPQNVGLVASTNHLPETLSGKHFIEPAPSIPKTSSPPPTPRKRVSLLQPLAENKTKRRESLLRTALEH